MTKILLAIVDYIYVAAFVVLGGWLISEAVKDFKDKHYFCFGVDIMLSVWCATNILSMGGII